MAPIPSTIPGCVVAGDSLSWSRSFDDYPASAGWALSYTLISPTAVKNFNATADGDGFIVSVAAADTVDWPVGSCRLVETLSNGTQRVTVGNTPLQVSQNLAIATQGVDLRSHAEKMLASIEAWLESKAPTAGALEIDGRKIQNYPLGDLLAMRDKYAAIVKREQAGPNGPRGTRILVRM